MSEGGKSDEKSSEVACNGCGLLFKSRNAIFKHLTDTDGACLSGQDYVDYCKYVRPMGKKKKVLLLYGYLPSPPKIKNGEDAANILLSAVAECQKQMDGFADEETTEESFKVNRSYGNHARAAEAVAQDEGTGAITEVLAIKLRPLSGGRTVDQWLDQVQSILDEQFTEASPVPIRILAREEIINSKFNAEMDVTHRRVEYVLPVDLMTFGNPDVKEEMERLPPFSENTRHTKETYEYIPGETPEENARKFLHGLKKMMQRLATQVIELDMNDKGAVMEKKFNLQKRRAKRSNKPNHKKKSKSNSENDDGDKNTTAGALLAGDKHRVLKRRRFHNFTPMLMAHEYLANRRLDRMWHRSTLRFPSLNYPEKTFITISMTGDMFLTGQVSRLVGLFLAIANGLIEEGIVDCLFDEEYPHLVPTPPAPMFAVVAAEATYMTWEGKLKTTLNPRICRVYNKGFNQTGTLERVKKWQDEVHEAIAAEWLSSGCDETNGRLVKEKEWTENVLSPWAHRAKEHLEEYRKWKEARQENEVGSADGEGGSVPANKLIPPIESVDASVPDVFHDVLFHLRRLDESGQWPSTTLKRQLVMVSTGEGDGESDDKPASLSVAHIKARNNKEKRSCAYSFVEGQGGASGSFSVGVMPGSNNKQPKSNFLFPELIKAAFELEVNLFPDREPSSTIAINRNAQFRPHTDSGAGAGQSTSLIVGLGTYAGGELLVEGEKHDIRYKGIEFNGWKQRHWTLPFKGERYSLVWFTPKGCEGMRGIDLNLSAAGSEVMASAPETMR
jgi:tRNA U38,U39,U40 pseudouridine synthase TruA